MYIGYLIEYPDYMTQGENIEELQDNLKDIYKELTSGAIPLLLHREINENLAKHIIKMLSKEV